MSTGVRNEDQLVLVFHGARPTAALMAPLLLAASMVPPPPMDQPMTASRFLSTLLATRESLVSVRSAALSCWPRDAGRSPVELVSMVITTKPCEPTGAPYHGIDDGAALNPGPPATPP